ncbi:MAG: ROK family protein [Bacteroidales bacterium]|nr:ROK family protein [Bacteroidales bacterium]
MTKIFLGSDDEKGAQLKRNLIKHCISEGSVSIAEFSKEIGLSVPTVTKIVGELIEDGYLRDNGKMGTTGGRRPSTFGLNPKAGYMVGIDVARQHFHIAIMDFKGDIVDFIQDLEFVLKANAESFRSMCRIVKDEVAKAGISWDDILGVGVSLSGRVNPETGYSLTYFVSDDLPLNELFEKEFGVPVGIENDSRAMAYGEYISLGKKADRNTIVVNLSWGLGMGMVLDGELYYGKSGFSGEIGHFPVLDNDIICRCGKVGCLETGASGSALHRMIIEELESGRTSSLSKSYSQNGNVELHEILDAIEDGDMLAIEGIETIGATLGRGLAGVLNIFNPGMVIIGGRLIVGKDYLMLPLKTAVNKHSLSKVSTDTKFRLSTLGRKAASVGDCLLSRKRFLGI